MCFCVYFLYVYAISNDWSKNEWLTETETETGKGLFVVQCAVILWGNKGLTCAEISKEMGFYGMTVLVI